MLNEMRNFWLDCCESFPKKKKARQDKLRLGLELKRCYECRGPERPCLADDKPATFHRWVEEETALLRIGCFMKPEGQLQMVRRFREEGVIDGTSTIEKLRTCSALVEYADGSVGRVKPELIQFLDRKEG